MSEHKSTRQVSVVLFDGFELLDAFGPVELLSQVPDVAFSFFGENELVRSAQGVEVVADHPYDHLEQADILLIPGGWGTRALVKDTDFLTWLRKVSESSRLIASVCTGSALLAAAGLLEGREATSNKVAFDWVSTLGENVRWQPRARWVEDGNTWTSSGIAAGMDMTVSLIARLFGTEVADQACRLAEYTPHTNRTIDPFAPDQD